LRWLLRFRKLDMTQPEQRQALVDTFINAIYLYNDKVLITFNYKEGTETVAFGEAVKAEKSSDMSARGAPDIERQIVRFGVLFVMQSRKFGACTVNARFLHGRLFHRIPLHGLELQGSCCQFMFDLLLSVRCLLFCGKTLPFVAALAVLIFVGVADAVRIAALRNICHTVASLSSCPVEPRIEAVLRYTDASAYPQDTELGGAVAQVVSRAQADGQHSCDLFHRVHQLRGCRADSRRLDGIGLSDHFHCSGIRVRLQEVSGR